MSAPPRVRIEQGSGACVRNQDAATAELGPSPAEKGRTTSEPSAQSRRGQQSSVPPGGATEVETPTVSLHVCRAAHVGVGLGRSPSFLIVHCPLTEHMGHLTVLWVTYILPPCWVESILRRYSEPPAPGPLGRRFAVSPW